MALANVAIMLARWGYNILVIDWDLEAPGLDSFFVKYSDLPTKVSNLGILDLLKRQFSKSTKLNQDINWQKYVTTVSFDRVEHQDN